MIKLSDWIFHQPAEIGDVMGKAHLQERLLEMGFVPGAQIELVGRMPLGGPFIVRLEKGVLALRLEEAECIKVKR